MSPSETSDAPGLLEHPAEAFAYYREHADEIVICEQKHMGSRAVLVLCRDREAARRRFGIAQDEIGVCYTRTGRRFFSDLALESQFLESVHQALESAALWDELKTD